MWRALLFECLHRIRNRENRFDLSNENIFVIYKNYIGIIIENVTVQTTLNDQRKKGINKTTIDDYIKKNASEVKTTKMGRI